MELRQIRYFLAVAEARHFTKAAQTLGISQSTLSAQVKELERDLGTPLFDRTGRAVRLSEAGKAFLEHAARAVRDAEAGRDA
ncbi:LysR family transcriptional regulator, partial [Singulisphaera rosea]